MHNYLVLLWKATVVSGLILLVGITMDSSLLARSDFVPESFVGSSSETTDDFSFVDFRDLLLSPEEARRRGGSGTSPYGDSYLDAFGAWFDMITLPIDGGTLAVNELVIRPTTEQMSGTPGLLNLTDTFYGFTVEDFSTIGSLISRIEGNLSGLVLANLDNVVSPLLLEPTSEPDVLRGVINMAKGTEQNVDLSFILSLGIESPIQSLAGRNEFEITASIGAMSVETELLFQVMADTFFALPWGDEVPSIDCLLSAVALSEGSTGISILEFALDIDVVEMALECVSCSSPIPSGLLSAATEVALSSLSSTLPGILRSFLLDGSFQPHLDGMVEASRRRCPEKASHREGATRRRVEETRRPVLSEESVDTFLFLGIAAIYSGFVLLVDRQSQQEVRRSDPLSSQESFAASPHVRLLDYSDLNTSAGLGHVTDLYYEFLRIWLGNTSGGELGILSVLESSSLEDWSQLHVDLDLRFDIGNFYVELRSVNIAGLDSFSDFDVVEPIGAQTLWNFVALGSLTIEVNIAAGDISSSAPAQNISVQMSANDLEVEAALFLPVDIDKFGGLRLDALLNSSTATACLLSAIPSIQLPSLTVLVSGLGQPRVTGLMADSAASMSDLIEEIGTRFDDLILSGFPRLFDGLLLDILDVIAGPSLGNLSACPTPITRYTGEFIDFRDLLLSPGVAASLGASGESPYGQLGHVGFDIADWLLLYKSEGQSNVNDLIVRPLSKALFGSENLVRLSTALGMTDELSRNSTLGFILSRYQVTVDEIRISNLDSFSGPIRLFQPSSDLFKIENEITLLAPEGLRPPGISLRVLLAASSDVSAVDLRNELELNVTLNRATISSDIQAALSTTVLETHIGDLLDPYCLMSLLGRQDGAINAFKALAVDGLVSVISGVSVDLRCLSCSSQGLQIVPDLLNVMTYSGAIRTLSAGLTKALDVVVQSDSVQGTIDDLVRRAPAKCPSSASYQGGSLQDAPLALTIPLLPPESVDTALFAGVLTAWSGLLLFVENQRLHVTNISDPLEAQAAFVPAVDTNILDLEDMRRNTGVGRVAQRIFDGVRSWLDDEAGISNTLSRVEAFFRESSLLDWSEELSFEQDGLSFRWTSLHIDGLETSSDAKIFEPIAPQTTRSQIRFDSLSLELRFSIGFLSWTEPAREVSIRASVEDVAVDAALFSAVDLHALYQLSLASMLNTTSILPCLLSAVSEVQLPRLSVAVGTVKTPVIQGLGEEAAESASTVLQALTETFQSQLVRGLPLSFEGSVKKIAAHLLDTYTSKHRNCPSITRRSGDLEFIDFRALFLAPNNASSLGASGRQPYGSLGHSGFDLLDGYLRSTNEDGKPKANELLQALSREDGTILVPQEIYIAEDEVTEHVLRSVMDRYEFRLSEFRLHNLATLSGPLTLLKPTLDPFELENSIKLGTGQAPVGASFKVLFAASKNSFSLDLRNNLEFHISLDRFEIESRIRAIIPTDLLYSPFQNFVDVNCILAMLAGPERSGLLAALGKSISISNSRAFFDGLAANITCISCSSRGLDTLPEMIAIAKESSMFTAVSTRLPSLVESTLGSNSVQNIFDGLIAQGRVRCPLDPLYDEGAGWKLGLTLPHILPEAVETVACVGLVVGWAAFIVFIENQRLQEQSSEFDALSTQDVFSSPADVSVLNLSNFRNETSLGPIAGMAFDGLKEFVARRDESGALSMNAFVRSFLRNSSGIVLSPDLRLEASGLAISLHSITINGLDSFLAVNVLDAIGAQTLWNSIRLGHLSASIGFSVGFSSWSEPPRRLSVGLSAENIVLNMALFAAIDRDRVGSFEVGSLFRMEETLACLVWAAYSVQVPVLSVSVDSFTSPVISGFFDEELAAIATATMAALGARFRARMLFGLPVLFGGSVTSILNGLLGELVDAQTCRSRNVTFETIVDFRKLFLSQGVDEADTYGYLPVVIKQVVDWMLGRGDREASAARLNDFIAPLTKLQSGTSGIIRLENSDIALSTSALFPIGIEEVTMHLVDVAIENITVGPSTLLEPDSSLGELLHNRVLLGTDQSPLRVSINMTVDSMGVALLTTNNAITVEVTASEVDILTQVIARIYVEKLLALPVSRLLDINCLLSVFLSPPLNEEGIRAAGFDVGFGIDQIVVSLTSMRIKILCPDADSCTSKGLLELPRVMTLLEDHDVARVIWDKLSLLVSSLVLSDFVQTLVDRQLVSASSQCLANGQSDAANVPPTYPLPPFPCIDSPTAEALVFVLLSVFAVVSVVIALSHNERDVVRSEPAADETAIDENEGGLIDLREIGRSVKDSFPSVAPLLRDWWERLFTSENGDLGFNEFLRSNILDGNGAVGISLPGALRGAVSPFSVHRISITGLDTLQSTDALEIVGPHTMQAVGTLGELSIEVDVSIETTREVCHISEQNPLVFTVALNLSNISASLSATLGLDEQTVAGLEVGHLLDSSVVVKCLTSPVKVLKLNELDVSVTSIDSFSVAGFESEDLSVASNELYEIVMEHYRDSLAASVRPVMALTTRSALNNWLEYLLAGNTSSSCSKDSSQSYDSGYIDFRDLLLPRREALAAGGGGESPYGDLVPVILSTLLRELSRELDQTGASAVAREAIRRVTEAQSGLPGRFLFSGALIDQRLHISLGGFESVVVLGVSDIFLEGVDSVGDPLSVLSPVEDQALELHTSLRIGVDTPMRVGGRFHTTVQEGDAEVKNEIDFSIAFSELAFTLFTILKLNERDLLAFAIKDIGNIHCWMAVMPQPQLDERGVRLEDSEDPYGVQDFEATIGELVLNASCFECMNPSVLSLADALATDESSRDATEIANSALSALTGFTESAAFQVVLDRLLVDAPSKCPHRKEYKAEPIESTFMPVRVLRDTKSATEVAAVFGLLGLLLAIAVVWNVRAKVVSRKRFQDMVRSLPEDSLLQLQRQQEYETEKKSQMNSSTNSLIRSTDLPVLVRLAVPAMLLGNIALFISGNLSPGVAITIILSVAGREVKIELLRSLLEEVVDIWNSGARLLGAFIFVFSGVWPHVKQTATLLLWIAPPSLVSVDRRGSCLLLLDSLAKYNAMDLMAFTVTVVAYRIQAESVDVGFIPDGFYSLDILLMPKWGVYSTLIAQVTSHFISNCAIYCHRLVEKEGSLRIEQSSSTTTSSGVRPNLPEAVSLCASRFRVPNGNDPGELTVRRGVAFAVTVGLIMVASLSVMGCALPLVQVSTLGLVGVIVDAGQGLETSTREYSFFGIMKLLTRQGVFAGRAADIAGLLAISVVLCFTVLLIPLLQCCTLVCIWTHNMSTSQRRKLAHAMQVLTAWHYIQVLLLAFLLGSWQLGKFSVATITKYCGRFDELFGLIEYADLLPPESAECFRLEMDTGSGFYVLLASTIMLVTLRGFVMDAASQHEHDTENRLMCRPAFPEMESAVDSAVIETHASIKPEAVQFTDRYRWLLVDDAISEVATTAS